LSRLRRLRDDLLDKLRRLEWDRRHLERLLEGEAGEDESLEARDGEGEWGAEEEDGGDDADDDDDDEGESGAEQEDGHDDADEEDGEGNDDSHDPYHELKEVDVEVEATIRMLGLVEATEEQLAAQGQAGPNERGPAPLLVEVRAWRGDYAQEGASRSSFDLTMCPCCSHPCQRLR
jgi:hypothetical protein